NGSKTTASADFNNMDSSTIVNHILTHRVHIDHPKNQILRDRKSAIKTWGTTKKTFGAHALVSYIHKQRRTNHKDYQNCLFACFLSQMEPKKKAIGTKRVYMNKKDERGIVVRNKDRMVAQGHRQEEGIDYDEISSGSTTTHSNISLPDYEAFCFDDDHIKEISSGSTTTHSDISLSEYDSFIFNFAHIISPSEYDCFYFRDLPDPGELMSVLNSRIRENLSPTRVTLPIEEDHSPLLAYVVWIFVAYLTYPVIPPYLHPFGNEDTIFDPGITISHFYSSKPGSSHRHGAFKKFNTHRSHLNEWPMIINGKNTPLLDVLLFHFYPP
nr:ribonuclease H-like domain-containing protein [Tanacetum cinerariifolium]